MAYLTTDTPTGFSLRTTLRPILDKFFKGRAAAHAFQRLNGLSDTELSNIGLARQDLPGYIFRNYIEN